MPRLALTCSCGWKFFIPDSTQGHEVTCSSCGQPVPIPGRKMGEEVLSPGMLAAKKNRREAQIKLLIGLGVGVAVLVVVLVMVMGGGGQKHETDEVERPPQHPPIPVFGTPNRPPPTPPPGESPGTTPETQPGPRPPPVPVDKVNTLKRSVLEAQWQINIAGIVVEVLRLRGCVTEADRITAMMEQLSAKILRSVGELASLDQKLTMDPHLMAGDRIVWFAQQNLTALRPADAAAFLEGWLLKLRTNTLEQAQVVRGKERVGIYIFFQEETKEMLQLAKIPATATADGAVSSPPVVDVTARDATPLSDVPPVLVKEIRARMQAIPQVYVPLFPADEVKRMESLFRDMKGTAEDLAFLNSRVLGELISKVEVETALIKSKIMELGPKAKEGNAQDTIFFKDGRKVEGKVEEETEEFIKIKSRFASVKVLRSDIARVERGKGAGAQYPDKFKAAQGKVPDLVALMGWCKENNLKLEKEYVAYLALGLDPLNEKARTEVGLGRPLGGGRAGIPESNPAARNDAVAVAIEGLAADVAKKYTTLGDVASAMRSGTEAFRYMNPVVPPEKSAAGARYMGNPLTFNPASLTPQIAVELGTWWGGLTADDRREFAKFFGLWCAYQRQISAPRK
jgi:hypothetical protein